MKIEILEKKNFSKRQVSKISKISSNFNSLDTTKLEQIHVTEECDITDQLKSSY